MEELVKECFVPGVKGVFELKPNLPLLKSTNLAILKRQSSNDKKQTKTQLEVPFPNGSLERNRCNSNGADFCKNGDLHLITACWDVILSFMGDQTPSTEKGQPKVLFGSTIDVRRQNLASKKIWRKLSNSDAVMKKRLPKRRPASMLATTDYNGNSDPPKPLTEDKQSALPSEVLANMTVLEKVRFLSSVGLENPCYQDEIYCQIMKQLVDNPSTRSNTLGWILLAVIMGCFSPSEKILDYVEAFLNQEQTACSSHCLGRLTRTLVNGDRKNPPCSLELQAAKSRQEIRVPVICMDQSVRTIAADSATTAAEMCETMASKNRMGDTFGFSLYLALDKKLVLLGSEGFRVMDAISQAESFSKQNGVREAWKIYYRREFFFPLDAAGGIQNNQMKTWLTYSQICGGVQSGEYQCTKAQDLALLLAHQYYVRHGLDKISMKRVMAVCEQSLPTSVYSEGKTKKWCRMVYTTLKALEAKVRRNGGFDTLDIMRQVARYGSVAFIENFTKSFFLSSFKISGHKKCSEVDVILKINHNKIVVCRNGATTRTDESTADSDLLLEANVDCLNSSELQISSQDKAMELKLTLTTGNICLLRSSQLKEIAKIFERYIFEVMSAMSTESSA